MLPVHQSIDFKILLFTFKCLHGQAPPYLSEFLKIQTEMCEALWSTAVVFKCLSAGVTITGTLILCEAQNIPVRTFLSSRHLVFAPPGLCPCGGVDGSLSD